MGKDHPVPLADILARMHNRPASERSLVALLPVLEHDYRAAQVYENAAALRLPELVHLALTGASAYWIELALDWLEAGFPISKETKAALRSLSLHSTLEQSLRHRTGALFRHTA